MESTENDYTLTPAQARYLAEIRRDGKRTYNGRALRPLERLCALGLITIEYDHRPQSKGNGVEWTQRLTARSTGFAPSVSPPGGHP